MKIATIDFETLDTTASTYILSVGLTAFDITQQNTWDELRDSSMHLVFNERGQNERTKSLATQEWWRNQTEQAWILATDRSKAVPLVTGIDTIIQWINNNKIQALVGNGVGFDNAILAHACKMVETDYPLPYWSDLDLRTMKMMSGMDKLPWPECRVQHYALHDAIYEAMCAQDYYRECHP